MADVIRHPSVVTVRSQQVPVVAASALPAADGSVAMSMPPWRAGWLAAAVCAATLLLHAPAHALFDAQTGLVLALVGALVAAWLGGLWSGLGATLLLALLTPWDGRAAVASVVLFVPFGLLAAVLGQSRHDLLARRLAEPLRW